jgi:8-hydroxy-5-deazaflavin:NADPH oxidoreductase
MQVTIIGAGNMGRGIGSRLVAGGHDVKIIDNDSEQSAQLADELAGAGDGSAEGTAPADPLSGDVVVLAVWYPPSLDAVEQYGDQLDGKVVVDISNPVDTETFDGLVTPADSSAAEEVAKKAPAGAKVVKAFNTTFAGTLVEGEVGGQPLDVFIAGDDEGAKETVAELARSGGLNPVDAGSLKRARELEALGFLHMKLQDPLGSGYGSTIKVVQPS